MKSNGSFITSALPIASNVALTDRFLIIYNAIANSSVSNGSPQTRTISVLNFANTMLNEGLLANLTLTSLASLTLSNNFSMEVANVTVASIDSVGLITGNGAGLTSINATNITTGQLNVNANNALYIGGLPAANVVSNAQLSANLGNYLATNASTFAGTANNTSYVGSVTAANVVSNAQLQANISALTLSLIQSSTNIIITLS